MQQVLDACTASSDCYISYDWNNRLKYAFIFHFFGLLWTNQFIVGLSSVVVAGAVANFYWSRGDTRRCAGAWFTGCHAQPGCSWTAWPRVRNAPFAQHRDDLSHH